MPTRTRFPMVLWLLGVAVTLACQTSCWATEPSDHAERNRGLSGPSRDLSEDRIPNTVEESFALLDQALSEEQRSRFKHTPEKEIIGVFHMGLGLQIRNNWIHSAPSALKDYFRKLGIDDPDDMSAIILVSFHRHLNSRPIRLEEQLAHWKDFEIPSVD